MIKARVGVLVLERGKGMLKQLPLVSFLIVLLSISVVCPVPKASAPSTTELFIDPSSIVDETLTPSKNFTITVKVADVVDLFAYEFKIYYNNTILNATKVVRPPGHFMEPQIDPGNQFVPKWEIKNDYNATHGRIFLSFTLLAPETARTGSGTLVQITFRVQGLGATAIAMKETKLANSAAQPITHVAEDGYFSNIPLPPPPPPAKIHVDPKETSDPALTPSHNFTINVNILDASNVYAFEFKLNYSATILEGLEIQEGAFLSGAGSTLVLKKEINNTLGFVQLSVTLTSPASANGNGTLGTITFNVTSIGSTPLTLVETSLTDPTSQRLNYTTENGFFSNKPLQSGDLNDDGIVDIYDVEIAALAFGATPDNPRWNARADLNYDGIIDLYDLILIILNFNGPPVVAEFPSLIAIALFMMTALAVAVLYRKKHTR
jgi:hypothetical protein